MPTPDQYQSLYAKAQRSYHAGDSQSAIEQYSQLVSDLAGSGAESAAGQPDLSGLLADAANELTNILRWEKRYDEALLQVERLIDLFPERSPALRTLAANLKIEGGRQQEGIKDLSELAQSDRENIWGWITLGTAHLWTEQYDEGETVLLQAARMEGADNADRALALKYLVDLYGLQKRVHQAVDTWEEACQLDPELRSTLPDLVATLIHLRYLRTAEDYIKLERCRLRRLFYEGLLNFSNGLVPQAAQLWNQVVKYDPETLAEGHDEYAEACVRLLLPSQALGLLEPLIERGDVNHWRLIIAGLAYAQQRIINHAKGTLNVALRMADLEQPRRTRPAGTRRILDARARIFYAQVRIDDDVRQELDGYFIPRAS
jgi:tetratricopeptide (TPR) repeat protein